MAYSAHYGYVWHFEMMGIRALTCEDSAYEYCQLAERYLAYLRHEQTNIYGLISNGHVQTYM